MFIKGCFLLFFFFLKIYSLYKIWRIYTTLIGLRRVSVLLWWYGTEAQIRSEPDLQRHWGSQNTVKIFNFWKVYVDTNVRSLLFCPCNVYMPCCTLKCFLHCVQHFKDSQSQYSGVWDISFQYSPFCIYWKKKSSTI